MPKNKKQPLRILRILAGQRYSTIDQFVDGNAHPAGYRNRGPFFNREAPAPELTEAAKKILENKDKDHQ